ncbi:MAG: peptidylprolyl isomerase [Cyanobacteria bacterium J06636_28]
MITFGNLAIDSEQLTSFLKREMRVRDLCKQEIYSRIVTMAAKDKGVTISDPEIQAEADRFRHQMKLESAKDTIQWLEDQLITAEEWEEGIHRRLLTQKLAKHLFEHEVPTYFMQNKLNYEKVILYRIVVRNAPLAQELFYQITEAEISFYQAAHQYDTSERRRFHCGYEGTLSRRELTPDMAAQVFGSQPKDVLGPIQSEEGYDLLMVEDFLDAELTEEIQTQILNQLFNEWLNRELIYLMHKD